MHIQFRRLRKNSVVKKEHFLQAKRDSFCKPVTEKTQEACLQGCRLEKLDGPHMKGSEAIFEVDIFSETLGLWNCMKISTKTENVTMNANLFKSC